MASAFSCDLCKQSIPESTNHDGCAITSGQTRGGEKFQAIPVKGYPEARLYIAVHLKPYPYGDICKRCTAEIAFNFLRPILDRSPGAKGVMLG